MDFKEFYLLKENTGDEAYSWLAPDGEIWMVPNRLNHGVYGQAILKRLFEDNKIDHAFLLDRSKNTYDKLFHLGYFRITKIGQSLSVENNKKEPKGIILDKLIQIAQNKGLNKIIWDRQIVDKVIWGKDGEESRARPEMIDKMEKQHVSPFYRGTMSDSTKLKGTIIKENEEDEELELEPIYLRGEYWFDESGKSMYADGDSGDMNHEAYVIQRCASDVAAYYNLEIEYSLEEVEEEITKQLIEKLDPDSEDYDAQVEEIEYDPASAIIKDLSKQEQDASDLVLTAYGSIRDARKYAIEKWNWSRVHGNNVEVKKLDSDQLKRVADGIDDALESEGNMYEEDSYERAGIAEYVISTYTGKRFKITLNDMEMGNVSGLENDELELKNTAARQQLRQLDVDQMPSFYKNKGIIGDSFTFDSFIDFILENSAQHSYSCLMADFSFLSKQLQELQDQIEDDDLYDDEPGMGKETEFHATALYGIHSNSPKFVYDKLDLKPVTFKLSKLSLFENEKYDVLKFDVVSPDLNKLNKECCEKLEYTNKYPDYKCHATVAYLKPGKGKKYTKLKSELFGKEYSTDKFIFSDNQKNKVIWKV